MSVTEDRVRQLINEQLYNSTTSGVFGNFTLQEKVAYALKLSLNRVTTDAFASGKEWFKEPEIYNPVLKSSILKNTPLPYSVTQFYYLVVQIDGKKYITSRTLGNAVTTFFNYSITQITNTSNNFILAPSTADTATNIYDSRIPISGDFNANGLLTRLPRNAWASFVYWKKQITGSKAKRTNTYNPEIENGVYSSDAVTSTGTYPNKTNNLSSVITLTGEGSTTTSPSGIVTFNNIKTNQFVYNELLDYTPLQIISNTIVDNYITNSGNLNQLNVGAPQELLNQIYLPVVLNLSVPTYSTWNSVVDMKGDNMAFYNPLLERSLSETFGYQSNGQGNGYAICRTDTNPFTNINTTYGSVSPDIPEGSMIFNGDTGFVQFFGLVQPLFGTTSISVIRPPLVTALKYVGETFTDGLITQSAGLPDTSIFNEKDLRIDTATNTIYRLGLDENNQKAWISIGGGGAGLGGKWSGADTEGDIYYEAGKVSIGKSTAEYILDVSGSFNLNNLITSNDKGVDVSGRTILNNQLLIGKTSSDYRLDVDGSFNATEIRENGTLLTAKYAPISHTHTISEIDGLNTALSGKANTNHTHTVSDITDFNEAIGGKWIKSETVGDIYYEAGKVSIGKSTAEYTLDVSGSFNLNNLITSNDEGVDVSGRTILNNQLLIGKTSSDYRLDVDGSFNLNNMIISKNNILDISGTTVIKGDLTVQGNYTIQGDTYVIHTEEVEISNNTLILNSNIEDNVYGGLAESELESGIIIKRAKIDETTFAEPYKIIYKDDRTDPDEYLQVGISGNLHRVATIETAKKNTNHNQFIKWNGESGQLIPDTDISSSNTHLYVNKKLQTTEDIYTKFSDATFSSVFPHQDNNQDIGLWGILNKMFDQPPKFNQDSIVPSTVGFTINWSKSFNTLKFAPTGAEVPFIKNIWIDIWNGTTWASVSKTLLSSVTTFTFDVGTTYGGVTITTIGTYKVRVYGVNDSGSNTYNFLEFDNLGVQESGKPSAPRSVSFPSSTFNTLTFRYTAPQSFDENIENSTEPPLENYEIKYKPIQVSGNFNTVRHRGTTDLNTGEITATVTTNLNKVSDISTELTNSTNTPIYPDMNYQFTSITAKNTLNANRSSNGVTPSLTIATPTVPITYGTAPIFPTLVSGQTEIQTALRSTISASSKSFRLSGGSSAINANYFNVPTTATTFTIGSNNSEIYVNRATDKLGRNISGSINVATVKIEYSTNGTSFVEDKTLNFNGFEANTYNGTTSTENGSGSRVLDFTNVSNTNSYTGTDPAYNGYGLRGVFRLSAISNVIGSSAFFKPATNKQSVRYTVNSPSFANQTYTYDFYVDDLNGSPTVTINTVTASINTTKWCYGIPSVNTFTLDVSYTIGNYASKFLPSDGKYATISTGGIVSTGSVNKTTTSLSESFPKNEAFTSRTLTSDINSQTISNAVSVRGFNLNNTTGVLALADLVHGSKLFLDSASFSGATLVSFATSGIFVYNANTPYTLSSLTNSSTSSFTLANNQLMFYKGAFYSSGNTEAFGNYSTGYFVDGKNHSTLKDDGDNVDGTIYKWVTKKVSSNVTINDATTRLKTVTIGYNGNNTTDLPANISNFVVYVLQIFIGGNSQTYNTPTTIWYNGSKVFNSNAFTTSIYSNYDAASDSIGIFENGKVTLDINSSVNCDVYVRVGLPANSTNRITSISMS